MSRANFTGVYTGTVIDNKDPDKLGRLKINVPAVTGGIVSDDLPWADPCFTYTADNKGIFFVPDVNSLVSVMFIEGCPYKPIWLGAIHRQNENKPPSEISTHYPERKIIKTNAGYIMFDEIEGGEIIEIVHKSGSYIKFENNGDIIINSVAGGGNIYEN